ncbi:MAG: hypothetical protein ACFE0Q_09000 [Anaerolineae bacterium]
MNAEDAIQIAFKSWGNAEIFPVVGSTATFDEESGKWVVLIELDIPVDPDLVIVIVDPDTGQAEFEIYP